MSEVSIDQVAVKTKAAQLKFMAESARSALRDGGVYSPDLPEDYGDPEDFAYDLQQVYPEFEVTVAGIPSRQPRLEIKLAA